MVRRPWRQWLRGLCDNRDMAKNSPIRETKHLSTDADSSTHALKNISPVTCHLSPVKCHMSCVRCYESSVIFKASALWANVSISWNVCVCVFLCVRHTFSLRLTVFSPLLSALVERCFVSRMRDFFLVIQVKRYLINSWKNKVCSSGLVTAFFQTF